MILMNGSLQRDEYGLAQAMSLSHTSPRMILGIKGVHVVKACVSMYGRGAGLLQSWKATSVVAVRVGRAWPLGVWYGIPGAPPPVRAVSRCGRPHTAPVMCEGCRAGAGQGAPRPVHSPFTPAPTGCAPLACECRSHDEAP